MKEILNQSNDCDENGDIIKTRRQERVLRN